MVRIEMMIADHQRMLLAERRQTRQNAVELGMASLGLAHAREQAAHRAEKFGRRWADIDLGLEVMSRTQGGTASDVQTVANPVAEGVRGLLAVRDEANRGLAKLDRALAARAFEHAGQMRGADDDEAETAKEMSRLKRALGRVA